MAASTAERQDASLRSTLELYGTNDKDYWSFRGNAAREHAHAYFQYPAMMVPQMVADLLSAARKIDKNLKHVFDPFVGSGTALTEAMFQGLDFSGRDVNPLAVLLCRAKTIPHFLEALTEKAQEVLGRIKSDSSKATDCNLPAGIRRKWFRDDVSVSLSKLRRAIRGEPAIWARRFLWVVLAETVRVSSNSRTSTFKLHIRTETDIDRPMSPASTFEAILNRNLGHFRTQKQLLDDGGLLQRGLYAGSISVELASSASEPAKLADTDRFSFMITSPPYGDNVTTIPYGQHSYLPLQWIDLDDIDSMLDETCLVSTHEIDRRSLGGSRRIRNNDTEVLLDSSQAFRTTLETLVKQPRDRGQRVTAFCRDLYKCIKPVLGQLRGGAYMVWIVGNRRVGGGFVPLDQIMGEFLAAHGATHISTIHRSIPTKRMAVRNSVADTMGRESILVFRTKRS